MKTTTRNFIICVLIAIAGTVTVSSCSKSKLGEININRTLLSDIYLNDVEAGENFDTLYNINIKEIRDAVDEKGTDNVKVTGITIKSITLTIPDSFDFDFSDIESSQLTIDGVVIGTLPENATGKTIAFEMPSAATQDNFKAYYENAKNIEVLCSGKARNHIFPSYMQAAYLFNIKADVLLE